MCERTFQVIDVAVDFSRRLPGGPSVFGSEGEVMVRCAHAEQAAACGFTASSACFVLVRKKKQSRLVFLPFGSRRLLSCLSLPADQTPVPPSPGAKNPFHFYSRHSQDVKELQQQQSWFIIKMLRNLT